MNPFGPTSAAVLKSFPSGAASMSAVHGPDSQPLTLLDHPRPCSVPAPVRRSRGRLRANRTHIRSGRTRGTRRVARLRWAAARACAHRRQVRGFVAERAIHLHARDGPGLGHRELPRVVDGLERPSCKFLLPRFLGFLDQVKEGRPARAVDRVHPSRARRSARREEAPLGFSDVPFDQEEEAALPVESVRR